MSERLLGQANELLSRHGRDDGEVFLEEEIFSVVKELLQTDPNDAESRKRTIKLMVHLCAMGKSTYGGGHFYEDLAEANPPYAQEVLRKGVALEPYYNNQPYALAALCTVISKNNRVGDPSRVFTFISSEDLRIGLLLNNKVESIVPEHPPYTTLPDEDQADLNNAVSPAVEYKRSRFMFRAGIQATVLYRMFNMTGRMKNSMEMVFEKTAKFTCPTETLIGLPDSLYDIAQASLALFIMTGDDVYREIAVLLATERDVICQDMDLNFRNSTYYQRYKEVYPKLKDLLRE